MEHHASKIRVHIAATVSLHYKGELLFYNAEPPVPRPRKPVRRPTRETKAEFHQRILEWNALLPPKKGGHNNAMTQAYYVEHILPVYAVEIQQHREQGIACILQQDNDNSHGTRSVDNLVTQFLHLYYITIFDHPPQSPDLNPIEGVWNILKQRVRKGWFDWHIQDEFKQVVQDEWDKITIFEIRARIAEMKVRCEMVIQEHGWPYKSELW